SYTPWPKIMSCAVPQGMMADLVTRCDDAARNAGESSHVFAHHEERRGDTVGRERVENRFRGCGVGTVVERQVRGAPAARAAPNRPAEQRTVRLVRGVRPNTEPGARREQGDQNHAGAYTGFPMP